MKLDDLFAEESTILRHTGGCHNCPRKKRDHVQPSILPGTRIIFVGDAPDAEDVRRGEVFTGNPGQLLRDVCAQYGLEESSYTYTVHCRPPKDATPGDKEVSACMNQFVQTEVRDFPFVVLVGNVAARAFFPTLRPSRLRGNVAWHPDFPQQRFYTITHPAYVLQNSYMRDTFEKQIERLSRIVKEDRPPFSVLQGGGDAFWEYLDHVLQQPLVSLDIETNRLESWEPDAHMRSIALTSDEDKALFVHEDEPHFIAVLEKLREFLENPKSRVVGQNVGFDLEWLEREFGFWVRAEVILDVQVLYYQLRGYQMISLKELTSRESDGYRYLVYEPHKEKDLWLLGQYNCEDVVEPLKLAKKALRELPPKTVDLCLRVGGPSGLALQRMTANGIHFNMDQQKKMEMQLREEREQILLRWQEEDPKFTPGLHLSDSGLEQYLFQMHNLPVLSKTAKTGKPQINKANIKEWVRQGFSPGEHLLALRSLEKKQSTYVAGYDKHVGMDGRVHPSFLNTVSDSGRTSAKDPNSQNVVRVSAIRSFFGVPDTEEWVYVESDYSQVELRIAVSLANDPVGIKAYRAGDDLHAATARAFAGPNYTKKDRTDAKPVNFSLIYGGSAAGLQDYAKNVYGIEFSLQQAEEYVRTFFGTYKQLPLWHEQCNALLKRNKGHAESAVGHRFYYKDWNSQEQKARDHAFRAHINSTCQGPASYLLLYALILTQREVIDRKLPHKILTINEVHDSIHAQVRKDALPEYVQILDKAVTEVARWANSWLKVPLVLEHEAGPDWGRAVELANV